MKKLRTSVLTLALLTIIIVQTSAQIHDYRFAQISDLHVDAATGKNVKALDSVVAEINTQADIAFVLVSGDVTDHGDFASLQVAKKSLDRLACPYHVIPGNRDSRFTVAAGTEFNQVFGDDRFRLQFNGLIFLGIPTGPHLRNVEGHVAPQDLEWVRSQLKNIGKKTPVFIVAHHPLKTGDVDNWFELTDIVRRYNTQAVIGGHYHRNLTDSYDGIPGVISRSLVDKFGSIAYTVYYKYADSLNICEKKIGEPEIQWASVPLTNKTYLEGDSRKFPRPSYSVNNEYKNIKTKWRKQNANSIYIPALVSGGRVFIADDCGVVTCFSIDKGKRLWQAETGCCIIDSLKIVDSKSLSVRTINNFSFVIDSQSGRIASRNDTEKDTSIKKLYSDGDVTAILKANNIYLTGSADGLISCYNEADNSLLWQQRIDNTVISGICVVSDHEFIVTTVSGIVEYFIVK